MLWSVISESIGCIVPPIDVSWKEGCVCRKIWSIKEGLVVDVPLKEEKIIPSDLGRSSSCPIDETSVDVAHSSSLLKSLLKSPIIMTPRPSSLSATAHLSAVCITYSDGLRCDCML